MTTANTGDSDLPENTWSVSALNQQIERVLQDSHDQFPRYIVGEIAEVNGYGFGTFFELRDLTDDPVISCIAWNSTVASLDHDLENGTEAVVEASVDFYPDRGDCQLVVHNCWPLGESNRSKELEEIRQQLAAEGVFDSERKQAIPTYPACIGLVTSPSGSAREDVWAAISQCAPRTTVKLHAASVQGDTTVESVIAGVQALDGDPTVETIILTRGGGSDSDLWAFNAEPLVRCVAACTTPIIVAIGHEDDETLAEYAADARAMTPTKAGVRATTPTADVLMALSTAEGRIDADYRRITDQRLTNFRRRIETATQGIVQRHRERHSLLARASTLERQITSEYRRLIVRRLDGLERRIATGLKDLEIAVESEATAERIAQGRIADLESRIDSAYRRQVERTLERTDQRITDAYRQVEADARVRAGTAEARRLRIIVAVLVGLLLLGLAAVVFIL